MCIICLCTQYRELQASLTRQAADWIAEKKQQAKGEREQKWRKVGCWGREGVVRGGMAGVVWERREGIVCGEGVKRGCDDGWEKSCCEAKECGEVGEGACGESRTCIDLWSNK